MTRLLLLLLALTTFGCAQSKAAYALKLSVDTDRSTYRIADTMMLRASLTNIGSADVYLWHWDLCWGASGLSMQIVHRSTGQPVQSQFLLDCVPPPPKKGDVYAFTRLHPGEFMGLEARFKLSDFVNKAGEYDVHVQFRSSLNDTQLNTYLSGDPIVGKYVWTRGDGVITAPVVRIAVK
jgi:hypothetical protein